MSELNKIVKRCCLAHPPARDRKAASRTANPDGLPQAIHTRVPTWFVRAVGGNQPNPGRTPNPVSRMARVRAARIG
jgi:hypothetical protein